MVSTSNIPSTLARISSLIQADTRLLFLDGKQIRPRDGQKLRNHSPFGFSWGYAGSRPAQAALGILLAWTRRTGLHDAIALAFYQDFKLDFVARWPINEEVN